MTCCKSKSVYTCSEYMSWQSLLKDLLKKKCHCQLCEEGKKWAWEKQWNPACFLSNAHLAWSLDPLLTKTRLPKSDITLPDLSIEREFTLLVQRLLMTVCLSTYILSWYFYLMVLREESQWSVQSPWEHINCTYIMCYENPMGLWLWHFDIFCI